MTVVPPDWLAAGQGSTPHLRWSFTTDASLIGIAACRESGHVFAADASGSLYRLNRRGKIETVARSWRNLQSICWSDTSDCGVAIQGDTRLCRINGRLELEWTVELDEPALCATVDSCGRIVVVSMVDGTNLILDSFGTEVARYESSRPLNFLQPLDTKPVIFGAAEYGLLCTFNLQGEEVWHQDTWSNVGGLSAAGDGRTLLATGFNLGIQSCDHMGRTRATYHLEGTAQRIATSYRADRLVAATLERDLYWLDSDGQLIWATRCPEDIVQIACDPLGEWILCGFTSGRVMRLDWESPMLET